MRDDRERPHDGRAARQELSRRYECKVLAPEAWQEFGGTGFYNVGLWGPGVVAQRAACERLVDRLAAEARPGPRLLLDVACGAGATTERLRSALRADKALGVDVSPALVGVARRRFPSSSYAIMDATALGLADASTDVLTCVEAAFHFSSRRRFLDEAARVLRPGGRLVLSDLVAANTDLLGRWMAPAGDDDLAVGTYRAAAAAAGFVDVVVEDVTDACWRSYCQAAHDRTVSPALRRWFRALADDGVQAYVLLSATRAGRATPRAPRRLSPGVPEPRG